MNTKTNLYQYVTILALVTGTILLIPLIAMQYTGEVNWTLSDFIFAGTLIFGTGLTYKLITRKSGKLTYRAGVALGLAGGFLLLWLSGAVGIIGSEDHPGNLMYLGVILVGIFGAIAARFKAGNMQWVLGVVAIAQALVPIIAFIVWPPEVISWGDLGVGGVFLLNTFFVALFILSALYFRYATQEEVKEKEEG